MGSVDDESLLQAAKERKAQMTPKTDGIILKELCNIGIKDNGFKRNMTGTNSSERKDSNFYDFTGSLIVIFF